MHSASITTFMENLMLSLYSVSFGGTSRKRGREPGHMPAFVEGMMQPPPAKKAKKGPLPKDFVYRKKQTNATSAGTSLQSGIQKLIA